MYRKSKIPLTNYSNSNKMNLNAAAASTLSTEEGVIVEWYIIARQSPNTLSLASQCMRCTIGFRQHEDDHVDFPFKIRKFILHDEPFCSKNVSRANAHRSSAFHDLVEQVKKIDHSHHVWISAVCVSRLGNDRDQIEQMLVELHKSHPNLQFMPLNGFGLSEELLINSFCVSVKEKKNNNKTARAVAVAAEDVETRGNVEMGAKKIYKEILSGDWSDLMATGRHRAQQAPGCSDNFESEWAVTQNAFDQEGDVVGYKLSVTKRTEQSDDAIGIYLRRSPDTESKTKDGLPVHQLAFIFSHMIEIYGRHNVLKMTIYIFFDEHRSGYNINNPELMKFLDLYRAGKFEAVFMASTTRPSRMKGPILAIKKIGEDVNTPVHYSKNVGENVIVLAENEQTRWQKNKVASRDYANALSTARDNLPDEALTGSITKKCSNWMNYISKMRIKKDECELVAANLEFLNRIDSLHDTDLLSLSDGDDSSLESNISSEWEMENDEDDAANDDGSDCSDEGFCDDDSNGSFWDEDAEEDVEEEEDEEEDELYNNVNED